MKHLLTSLILLSLVLMTSCSRAKTETGKSLENAKEAAEYLMSTKLDDSQRRAAEAVAIAVNPGIDLMERGLFGRKTDIKPTVTAEDWKQDAEGAKEGVIHQAAVAQSAIDAHFDKYAGYETVFWAGVATLFGSGIAKILQQKAEAAIASGALEDALEFGMDAINADTPQAKEAVKLAAIQRKKGTKHAPVLDKALLTVRDRRLGAGSPMMQQAPTGQQPIDGKPVASPSTVG